MNNEFVNYEQALALKELGFNEPCFGYYGPNKEFEYINWEVFKDFPYLAKNSEWQDLCGAATYSQAFGWLLEKHNLCGIIIPTVTMAWTFKTMTVVIGMVEVPPYIHVDAYDYSRREEAELECLKKLIEIVKNK